MMTWPPKRHPPEAIDDGVHMGLPVFQNGVLKWTSKWSGAFPLPSRATARKWCLTSSTTLPPTSVTERIVPVARIVDVFLSTRYELILTAYMSMANGPVQLPIATVPTPQLTMRGLIEKFEIWLAT